MNLFLSSQNNLDEVVFENRNKQYGAYVLRKSYDETLLKATLSSLGLLLIIGSSMYALSFWKSSDVRPLVNPIADIPLTQTILEDVEIIPDNPILSQAHILNTDNLRYNIVRDIQVTQPITTAPNPDLSLNHNGTLTPGTGGSETGSLTGTQTTITPPIEEPPISTFASDMPSFDGGNEAMTRYLRSEMMYPPQARQLGIEGKVMVEFVVQTDGSISDIKVLKGFGYGSEEEAMRVVQNMPKWIPGSQNGKRLAVRLVLPLQFRLNQ